MALCVRSIYCRGCSKPLCVSCALLDSAHGDLKCDISVEIQGRQEELDAMTQALEEQDRSFSAAQAQMHSAVSKMGRVRSDMEELIRSRVRQVVEYVQAQESELLKEVNMRYQRDYEEIAGQLDHLDAVLQRIRTGSVLVQRMKLYASDQEVLDMHSFLREALCRLRQEQPQSPQAAVRTDSFDELKVRLQDLVSCITQERGKRSSHPYSWPVYHLRACSWMLPSLRGRQSRKDHLRVTEMEIGRGGGGAGIVS